MKKGMILLLCLLLCGCDGLPRGREMGDMALLRTMGVDGEEEGVRVTVSTGGREPVTLSSVGRSVGATCLGLEGQSDRYVFFGYVDQVLLGEELIRDDVLPTLDYLARDRELSLGTRVWAVMEGEASETAGGTESRLSALDTDGAFGAALLSRSAGEVYADLLELGGAWMPALGGGAQELRERGYAVLKDGRLAGYLTGEAMEGLELLLGRPEREVFVFEAEGQRVSLLVTGAEARFSFGEKGELSVFCRVEAIPLEYEESPGESVRRELSAALAGLERARVSVALDQLQDWGADCLGMGAKAGLRDSDRWRALEGQWPVRFKDMETEIRVEDALRS